MTYVAWAVIVTIAVVLAIFTGVWGGLVWIAVAGGVLAVVFAGRARGTTVERSRTEPTGTTRPSPGGADTANQRVGQE